VTASPEVLGNDRKLGIKFDLVSLVSVRRRNWFYLCGTVESVEAGEIVEIANLGAVFMYVADKMVG
jgi:hypothetical protein